MVEAAFRLALRYGGVNCVHVGQPLPPGRGLADMLTCARTTADRCRKQRMLQV